MTTQTAKVISVAAAVGLVFGVIGGALVNVPFIHGALERTGSQSFVPSSHVLTLNDTQEESQTTAAVSKATPAVVSIVITKELRQFINRTGPNIFPFDNFFDFGFPFDFQGPTQQPPPSQQDGKPRKQEVGGGSGFIVSEDGLILTNRHVVSDDQAEYTVVTNDGKKFDATVLARDPINDLAVIKIKAQHLPVLALGNSDSIKIGQTVIAIGNSLAQYRNTVTKGVISGIGRKVIAGDQQGSSEEIDQAIQTDAAINPGNSGGPLINLAGEVIGINTAINQEGQSLGFAIPVNVAKSVIESVKLHGRIVRPWLGVRYVMLNDDIAKENKLSVSQGALVIGGKDNNQLAVIPGSPADKAGIVENDIITNVDAIDLTEDNPLAKVIAAHKPGDTVSMTILHRGAKKEINVKLEEFKD